MKISPDLKALLNNKFKNLTVKQRNIARNDIVELLTNVANNYDDSFNEETGTLNMSHYRTLLNANKSEIEDLIDFAKRKAPKSPKVPKQPKAPTKKNIALPDITSITLDKHLTKLVPKITRNKLGKSARNFLISFVNQLFTKLYNKIDKSAKYSKEKSLKSLIKDFLPKELARLAISEINKLDNIEPSKLFLIKINNKDYKNDTIKNQLILTMMINYLLGELIEVSGNIASSKNKVIIQDSHLKEMIEMDEEFESLYKKHDFKL